MNLLNLLMNNIIKIFMIYQNNFFKLMRHLNHLSHNHLPNHHHSQHHQVNRYLSKQNEQDLDLVKI